MIIKIKVYPEKEEEKENIGWWIEDNIAKVRVEQNIVLPDKDSGIPDAYLPLPNYVPCTGKASKLVCRMKDGNERVIVFQGEGYLLNDEGKTIEKFVA